MITVINYGGGNIRSIVNMLDNLDCEFKLSNNPDEVLAADKIIFPGQGHFGQSMLELQRLGLDKAIIASIEKNTPFLGICVGLQVLFENSEEAPGVSGLGVLKGSVVKFRQGKTPQIGWNKLRTTENNSILTDDYYYFVNSYYVKPQDESIISAYSDYHIEFCASVESGNLYGVQFHPEKSDKAGLNSIKKWISKHQS